MCKEIIDEVKEKLKSGGYGGLFSDCGCGCDIEGLAPCGQCERGDGYINDCKPGYVFHDPRTGSPLKWIVKRDNEAPTAEEWDLFSKEVLK